MKSENKPSSTPQTNNSYLVCTSQYNFNDGIEVYPNEVQKWHEQVLDYFLKNPDISSYSIRSGRGIVFGRKYKETNQIEIFEVTNGYNYFNYETKINPKS